MTHIDRALRSNLKLRHLQLIVALDEFRHLGRTAELLSVSQPAVSKMLNDVESMLGLVLFVRSARGTEPTTAGESLVHFSRSVLAQYERTRDEIAAVANGTTGRTRVGVMAVAMPLLLTRAIALLKARSQAATVLVEEGDLTHLLPKLRSGELDVFVGRLEPGYASPDLMTTALYPERMVAVVMPDHPLTDVRAPTWAHVAKLPCVVPPPWASLRVKLEQQFYRYGLEPPVDLIETSSYLSILTFVRDRGAVGFLAQSVAKKWEEDGLLRIVRMALELDLPAVGIITMRERRPSPATEQLILCLKTVADVRAVKKRARKAAQKKG
ncbi:LysR substrate-binding domain-containing protein [Alcaligenaceae bacterium A4P071]|nr:LysR substrate-binding domain-containing protein [Alcaligenaceae bacterium A4P071]